MAAVTRLGASGVPRQPYGSFAGKETAAEARVIGVVTRLGLSGVPRQPFGSFSGKEAAIVVAPRRSGPPLLAWLFWEYVEEKEKQKRLEREKARKVKQRIERERLLSKRALEELEFAESLEEVRALEAELKRAEWEIIAKYLQIYELQNIRERQLAEMELKRIRQEEDDALALILMAAA